MKHRTSRLALLGTLKEEICRLPGARGLKADDIVPEHRLTSELGVDSLSVIELGFNIEQALGSDLSIMDWFETAAPEHTLGSLLEYVVECVSAGGPGNKPGECGR